MVEESLAGGKHHIAHAWRDHIGERTVAAHGECFVGAVVANKVHFGSGELIAVHLVDPTLDGLYNLWVFEAVDMVPAAAVATIRAEVATIIRTLKGHAEVIALRVKRIAGVFQNIAAGLRVDGCDEDIETAHARMAVAREVEVAVGSEGWEHLVARSVDGVAEVFNASHPTGRQADAPDVETALATRHVGAEVEPLSIGRDSRVGIAGERVAGYLHLRGLAP